MNINIYNPYVRRELELYHHGILGMKWGKRNGPPYPLYSGAHSASEKKAGWRKSLDDKVTYSGDQSKKVEKKPSKVVAAGRAIKNKVHDIKEKQEQKREKEQEKRNAELLRNNKKPVKEMTDKELADSIERLKQEEKYKRALKGDFSDVTKNQNNDYKVIDGKQFAKDLMTSIGKQVVIPAVTGYLNYKIAERLAGDNSGRVDKVKTIMGKNVTTNDPKGEGKNKNNNKPKGGEEKNKNNNKPKGEEEKNKESDKPKDSSSSGSEVAESAAEAVKDVTSTITEAVKSATDSNDSKPKSDNQSSYADFLNMLADTESVVNNPVNPGTPNSLRKRTYTLGQLAQRASKQQAYKESGSKAAELNKIMTKYQLNKAPSLIEKNKNHGKEYSTYLDSLSKVEGVTVAEREHSAAKLLDNEVRSILGNTGNKKKTTWRKADSSPFKIPTMKKRSRSNNKNGDEMRKLYDNNNALLNDLLSQINHSYSNNYYNPYVRRELELYHHGVLGQEWGKRNGPPYPLFAGAHSASEKKAGWRKSLDNAKSDYADRKKSYKDSKRAYRDAKKASRIAHQDLRYAQDDTRAAKDKYAKSKAEYKESKRGILGSKDKSEAKKNLENSKYEFDRAKFNEGKLRETLNSKLSDIDTAKAKMKADKLLMREGKKTLREANRTARELGELGDAYMVKNHPDTRDGYGFDTESAKRHIDRFYANRLTDADKSDLVRLAKEAKTNKSAAKELEQKARSLSEKVSADHTDMPDVKKESYESLMRYAESGGDNLKRTAAENGMSWGPRRAIDKVKPSDVK